MNRRLVLASVAALSLMAPCAFAQTAVVAVAPPPSPAPAPEGAPEEGRLPVAEAERPITTPRFVLNPEADFGVPRVFETDAGNAIAWLNVSIGVSFGITDDLTVRALVLPLQLVGPANDGFHYGQTTGDPGPSVGATYRFLKGDVEIGASLDLGIVTAHYLKGFGATPGVPVRIHATKSLRIDTGAYLPILNTGPASSVPYELAMSTPSHTIASLVVPASVLYDIIEPLHVGVGTGFDILDLSNAGSTVAIPLGVFCGYAIAGKDGPILDIDPSLTFPTLLTPGGTNTTDTSDYVIGLSVGGFIYL